MNQRWTYLVVAVVLIQGSLTLNPIPEDLDHDWAAFRELLRDVAYRLPTTTVPRHYEVNLTPYFENVTDGIEPFTFEGNVAVYFNATVPVNRVVMHCNDLNITAISLSNIVNGLELSIESIALDQLPQCDPVYSFLNIDFNQTLEINQEYILRISFTGNIQNNMRGFYRSWYYDSTGKRWMGTTQFQPGHARQAFPCYDEPGFKATFDITINRETDFSPSISNMPIRTTTTLSNGRIAETFFTTPKTSTYLLAFIVSHYEKIAEGNDTSRPFDIYARDNAGSTGDWALEIGELLLEEIEDFTNYSYYGMAESLNMKQAAIPDFSAGAMENWGLLTYREALILYDPVNSNHFYKQRVANIISHEITHMYFGNLVTCAWWDSLWLNEGFARLYQYFLTAAVAPDLGYETRFITEQLQSAMLSDSVDTAHQLTNPDVNDPVTVSAHFSTITYAKGAAVIRMTRHFVGNDTYQKALRNYLYDRQFDVATPEDLFQAFDDAAAEDGSLSAYSGITVAAYYRTWSEQAGHPLLTVNIDHSTGLMTVSQARWERTNGQSILSQTWMIPITWTRGGDPEFYNLKPSQVLTEQVTVINRGTTGLEWVLFNKQESGFYRINYDETTWDLITDALRGSDRNVIHELNRAQIVDDVFQLARAGVLPYTRALRILSFLEFEDAYAPWDAAITGFNWLIRRVAHDTESFELLRNEILRLSIAVTAKLGYAEVDGESYMDGLQRMYVMQFLCNLGHPECVAAGVTNYQNLVNSNTFVPANMRPWVFCIGLREGDASSFNYLWNRYIQEDLAGEQVVMLTALGCTKDANSLNSYLDYIVNENDYIRTQDYTTALNGAVAGNEENNLIVFEWLKNNVEQTAAAFGSVATPLSYIAARLQNEEQIAEFQSWIDTNQDVIGSSSYNTGVSGIESTRTNLEWSENRVPEIIEYLTGNDTTTTSTTTTTTTTTTSAPPVEPEPEAVTDSGNMAFMSLFITLITLSINMLICC